MTYRSEWEDFIQRELITGSFKTELELKEYYEKSFEQNQPVIKELIENELSNLLQGEFHLTIQKDFVVVNYLNSNSNKEIFAMPCNYYGCQIDHEYIYGELDEVIPYIIYFILQNTLSNLLNLDFIIFHLKERKILSMKILLLKKL